MGKEDQEALDARIQEGEKKAAKAERKRLKAELKKKGDGFFADFKKFITKGNVLDMAVAVVVATSFNAIVNGLVKYIITPFVTYFTSGVSINEWKYVMRPEVLDETGAVVTSEIALQYGVWLQTILDFLIIAFSVFVAVRIIRNAERKLNAKEIAKQEAEAAQKKAEEDAKAAEAAAIAQAEADRKKAVEEEFYANVREQSELLRQIRDRLNK